MTMLKKTLTNIIFTQIFSEFKVYFASKTLKKIKTMQKINSFLVLILAAMLLSGCSVTMLQPPVSAAYSEKDVDSLLGVYHRSHDFDCAPPDVVREAFNRDFQMVYAVEWETSGANLFKADWETRGRDCKAYYDGNGQLLMYVFEASRGDLSEPVKDVLSREFFWHHIDEIKKFVKAGRKGFKIELDRWFIDDEVTVCLYEDGTPCYQYID